MHDIRAIREQPEVYDRGWASRGLAPQTGTILALDEALRAAQTLLQAAQNRRNEASRLIGQAKAKKDEAEARRLMDEVEALKGEIAAATETAARVGGELNEILAALPNVPAPDVPEGADERGNVEVRRWGEPFALEKARDHVDLGAGLGMMDF